MLLTEWVEENGNEELQNKFKKTIWNVRNNI